MAELLQSGAYDRHVRRTRLRYRRRRDLLIELLAEHTPPLTPRGIAAGLHVVVDLPTGRDEDDVVARAAAHDLALNSLTPFWHDPAGRPAASHRLRRPARPRLRPDAGRARGCHPPRRTGRSGVTPARERASRASCDWSA